MPSVRMNVQEFAHLLDQLYREKTIAESTWCGRCGYNLRTRPYIGVCPECGHRYNAVPMRMQNIFVPHDVPLPYAEVFSSLVSLGLTFALLRGAAAGVSASQLVFGGMFALLGLLFGWRAWVGLRAYRRHRDVIRRIESESEE